MSADHTKMPEMTRAVVVVRKSCWPSWELLWAAVSRVRAGDGVALWGVRLPSQHKHKGYLLAISSVTDALSPHSRNDIPRGVIGV